PLATAAALGAQGRAESARGFSNIAAKRRAEVQDSGQASTDYLQPGDLLRMEMKGLSGASLCGAIEQAVAEPLALP
ncbi:MAG: fumarylacetoacetate hydrolase, partial [Giesbergeria sp.]